MKTNTFCNQIVSTRFAGDIDTLVSDVFFAMIFGAYTVYVWELGGGVLTGVIAVLAAIFATRVIYQVVEWLLDALSACSGRQGSKLKE